MKSQPRPRSLFRIIFGRTTFVILGLLCRSPFSSAFPLVGKLYSFCLYYLCTGSSSVVIAILNRPMDSSFKNGMDHTGTADPYFRHYLICVCAGPVPDKGRWQRRVICLLKKTKTFILFRTHRCRKRLRGSQCAWKPVW